MAADNTGTNQGVTTKAKTLMNTKGPNIDAYYGPWNSTSEFETYMSSIGTIFEYTTIAVKVSGGLKKYVYYNNSWHEEGGGASDADSISYDPTAAHTTNNTVGKSLKTVETKIGSTTYSENANESVTDVLKEFKEFKEANSGSKTEPAATTTVDLFNYSSAGSTFTYDVDNKYTYLNKDTTFYQYTDDSDNKYYGVFKVFGMNLYVLYEITNSTTFTFKASYTESSLPLAAKKEFELGTLATVKRVNGEGESWQNGTVNLFCTKQNMALRNRCRNINFNGSTAWRVLIKSEDGNTIFVYKAKANGNYEWEINVPRSSTVNFNLLDKYFDRPEASSVSFDDSITQLSIEGNPINNVQTAIQLLATKIYGFSSTLIITLTYSNGIRVANTVINISAVFQGNEYDFSSQLNDPNNAEYVTTVDNIKKFKTNSSGECRIGLPIGATYELTFNDIANYIKPEPITGITDSTQTIIGASYQAISDYETVILKVVVHGVSGSITPSGKKVYIDTYNPNNTSVIDVEGLYEITLTANGTPNTVKIKEGSSYTTVTDNVIKIDKGVLYKVRLDDWDNTGVYTTSTSPLFNAQKVSRGVTLAYTYTLSGTYLLLKDLESEDGYKNYRIIEIDSTNNKIKIAREINGVTNNYWIYKNSNDVYIYEESQDVSTAYAWFEGINVDANNPIVGIGFRSQLLNNPSSSSRAISGTCAFCVIPYNVANVTAGALRESGTSYVANNAIDGLANEESWLEVENPTSVLTKNIHNITASIGNNTYNAFLPAYRQLEIIIQNIDNINLIFSIFNKSLVIAMNNANDSNLWSSTLGNLVNYTVTGIGANGYNKNMSIVGASNSNFATNTYKSIPVFPY